ncbi:hypothetical protein Raf01_94330 [Rugosimonospora africana]|uniref:Uncharacterized protein n=1 Tax=Rugosimonospora africana TaxID=556532 RepID=A0A8J3R754_9ACTN|nr:hypothetical protein Raf01_94330 [Rugosimonospora africana]
MPVTAHPVDTTPATTVKGAAAVITKKMMCRTPSRSLARAVATTLDRIPGGDKDMTEHSRNWLKEYGHGSSKEDSG